MIKVLHLVLGLQIGGLEKFVIDLIGHYSADVKPFVVCLENKGELGQRSGCIDIFEMNKPTGISLKTIWKIIFLTRELGIDIIHTHNPSPHFYGAIIGLLTHIPVVHTKHGRNYPTDRKKVWLNRISSFLTQRIVTVSQNAAEVCLDVEKIPASKVAVILNGIDTKVFRPLEKKNERIKKLVRLGIVARLSTEKDHNTLLIAANILATRGANFHIDIIGDGPLRDNLEKTVDELELSTFITFSGMRHDIPECLRKLDIFVLSSTTEGISLTLLEAMATGLPVVATNVGGNPEVVVDGETGYIVPPKDPTELANKLLLLMNDINNRGRMGKIGRQRVEEQFSINETAKLYEKLYRSLVRER